MWNAMVSPWFKASIAALRLPGPVEESVVTLMVAARLRELNATAPMTINEGRDFIMEFTLKLYELNFRQSYIKNAFANQPFCRCKPRPPLQGSASRWRRHSPII